MTREEITRIRVAGQEVGVVGLASALEEVAEGLAQEPEARIKEELLARLSTLNYIPTPARADYAEAFFRAFRRHRGEPVEEDPEGSCIRIQVLGAGCSQCTRLYQELIEIIAAQGLEADVEHVTDIQEIARYGILGTPALLVNGRVKCAGRVPTRKRIEAWLREP